MILNLKILAGRIVVDVLKQGWNVSGWFGGLEKNQCFSGRRNEVRELEWGLKFFTDFEVLIF